ncbi:methylmalonyl Co-A mutase-associated GTPase MeaB [Shewanella sp. Choline-02u-19]|uniref:methylmalonyl Co-A mutase-associated GTPase MeaB n=1 Tax=unclassified Shewanella TaxID=196818 RepID=UPI000C33EB90|nr:MULTISPECIES: methylmalonyl Co-A mutase-associated GTPase MeaB [unclassified Shewanella]PKH62386.1 methylmalonyl Co-A mutase-associated GTPase MeaB [Shewanella sp. Bg11-22]PKI26915.1 methylmalonyl Co-A mutase-associated GTPase MeaB [Shewanella sp. Choline-02u-19]
MESIFDVQQLRSGNRRVLSKLITLIESTLPEDKLLSQKILENIFAYSGSSIRVGITGIPGVGKSTFIEALGMYLIGLNKKVAVITIDPSSPINGGSILGDKSRMNSLSKEVNAFIRTSPSLGFFGGAASKTQETILACEVAGYDVVLVESVGVGQSEFQLANMVDFFLVLGLPNSGDELQGIKKGIIELADSVVVNKCDGTNETSANLSKLQYENALSILNSQAIWKPRVQTCSAIENINIDAVWDLICEYWIFGENSGYINQKRAKQNKNWMWSIVHEMIDIKVKEVLNNEDCESIERQVIDSKITPLNAAQFLMEKFDNKLGKIK